MSLMCLLRGHRAAPQETYNCGYWFSRCERCARDMVRSGKSWQPVPRGHRVVWKSGPAWHSLAPDFGAHLPVLHRDSHLPAHPPRGFWNRALVALGAPRPSETQREDAQETEAVPGIVFVVALWVGLQLLAGARFSYRAHS
jgi:hypothetical protein